MGSQVSEIVHCHAGWRYPEHPISVFWDSAWVEVEQVLTEWKTPEGIVYCISTKEGKQLKLIYYLERDGWVIEAI